MILTVTLNPAVDLTWEVDGLVIDASHRVATGRARAGGKGVNVARVLHGRGIPALAITTAGGENGAQLCADLAVSGIPHSAVEVAAPTRRSVAVIDTATGEATVLNEAGSELGSEEVRRLFDAVRRHARDATAVAICGSLPPRLDPEVLGGLVEQLAAAGTRVIVDATGPALLAAARAGAHMLKPNREELREATGESEPVAGAQALIRAGAGVVLVSLGAEGLFAVTARDPGRVVRARLRRVLRGNPTGAGDAAVAAIAEAMSRSDDLGADPIALAEMTRQAVAWSASAVLAPLAGELGPDPTTLVGDVVVIVHDTMEDL